MIRNPYSNINWSTYVKLISANHWHCSSPTNFMRAYNTGLRHFAISNYQPSYPTYPLTGNHHWALDPSDIPSDVIASPNSEKVRSSNAMGHTSALGSLSETPGHLWDTEVDGAFWTWQEKFDEIFDNLQFEDGGGAVVNHPMRSGHDANRQRILNFLSYDERVLGFEVVNHRSQRDYEGRGYAFDLWDWTLKQGYRCYGFFTPDEHAIPDEPDARLVNYFLGRNVLLVPSLTEQNALRAYRNGEFFGAFFGDRIAFTNVELVGNTYTVQTDDAERIDFISYSFVNGEAVENSVHTVMNNEGSFTITEDMIFVRAVAYEDADDVGYSQPIVSEKIFTQPIMFKTVEDVQPDPEPHDTHEEIKKRLLLV